MDKYVANKYAFDPSKYIKKSKSDINNIKEASQENKKEIHIMPSMLQELPKYELEQGSFPKQKVKINKKKAIQNVVVATIGTISIFSIGLSIAKLSKDTTNTTENIEKNIPNQVYIVSEEEKIKSKSLDELTYEEIVKIAKANLNNKKTNNEIEVQDIEKSVVKLAFKEIPPLENYDDLLDDIDNDVCSNCDLYDERLTDDLKYIIETVCNKWGVDPNLLIAIGKQESNLKNLPKTAATGIFQIESVNETGKFKAYNFETEQEEIVDFSKFDLTNIRDNAEAAAIMLQNAMSYFDNPLYSLQGYNYGQVTVKKLLTLQAKNKGVLMDQLTYEDALEIFYQAHKNPQKYINEKWKGKTYGDPKYTSNVTRYGKARLTYKKTKDGLMVYDLANGKKLKTYEKIDKSTYMDVETKNIVTLTNIMNAINNTNTKTKVY